MTDVIIIAYWLFSNLCFLLIGYCLSETNFCKVMKRTCDKWIEKINIMDFTESDEKWCEGVNWAMDTIRTEWRN